MLIVQIALGIVLGVLLLALLPYLLELTARLIGFAVLAALVLAGILLPHLLATYLQDDRWYVLYPAAAVVFITYMVVATAIRIFKWWRRARPVEKREAIGAAVGILMFLLSWPLLFTALSLELPALTWLGLALIVGGPILFAYKAYRLDKVANGLP